MAANFGMLIG